MSHSRTVRTIPPHTIVNTTKKRRLGCFKFLMHNFCMHQLFYQTKDITMIFETPAQFYLRLDETISRRSLNLVATLEPLSNCERKMRKKPIHDVPITDDSRFARKKHGSCGPPE